MLSFLLVGFALILMISYFVIGIVDKIFYAPFRIREHLLYDNRPFDDLEARQLLIRDYSRRLQNFSGVSGMLIPSYLAKQLNMD